MANVSSTELVVDVVVHFSRVSTVGAAVAAIIFIIMGISGNLLTAVALLRCPKLRVQATTTFVISLAISDLLFCSINLPLTASRYIHEQWILGETLCRLYPFFFYGNMGSSLMNMVAITLNRYVLISCPGLYPRIYTRCNILLMVAGVWLFSFGLLVPPLLDLWGTMGLDAPTFSCTVLRDSSGRSPKKFLFLFGFLLPCLAIIICYSAIFYSVRQSRLKVQSHVGIRTPVSSFNARLSSIPSHDTPEPAILKLPRNVRTIQSPKQTSLWKEDIRMTKMMLLIFASFLICFLPLMLLNVVDDEMRVPELHVFGSVLAWMSAVINPLIYAFKNRQYKQAFMKLLGLKGRGFLPTWRGGSGSTPTPSKTLMTEMAQMKTPNVEASPKPSVIDMVQQCQGQGRNELELIQD